MFTKLWIEHDRQAQRGLVKVVLDVPQHLGLGSREEVTL